MATMCPCSAFLMFRDYALSTLAAISSCRLQVRHGLFGLSNRGSSMSLASSASTHLRRGCRCLRRTSCFASLQAGRPPYRLNLLRSFSHMTRSAGGVGFLVGNCIAPSSVGFSDEFFRDHRPPSDRPSMGPWCGSYTLRPIAWHHQEDIWPPKWQWRAGLRRGLMRRLPRWQIRMQVRVQCQRVGQRRALVTNRKLGCCSCGSMCPLPEALPSPH